MQSVIRSFSITVLLGFFTVVSAGWPSLYDIDRYLIMAEDLYKKKDYGSAFRVMEKISALEEVPFPPSSVFHFKYARVALSADSIKIALDSINKYLSATGKEGQFYKEALALLREAEKAKETVISAEATGNETSADSGDRFDNEIIRAGGTCDGKPLGSSCWMELINHPKCYVWNDSLRKVEIMTWSGKCSGGFAQGKGILIANALYGTNEGEGTGNFQKGKRHGQWVLRSRYGAVSEGPYVDGNKHGQWVIRHSNEIQEEEGPYVDGKRHGQWVERDSYFGTVSEGPYVDGNKHGQWVIRQAHGSVSEGPYVDGKRHGQWVECNSDGVVTMEGAYVDDKEHEQWVYYYSDGTIKSTGTFVSGEKQGHWIEDLYDRKVWSEGYYMDDRRHGHWVTRDSTGFVTEEGSYMHGLRRGFWVERFFEDIDINVSNTGKKSGSVRMVIKGEGNYMFMRKHGDWVYYYSDGTVRSTGTFVKGEKHGDWVYYYHDGTLISRSTYENGNLIRTH